LITFREFHTYVTDFLFFKTGIPTRRTVDEVAPSLEQAAENFYQTVHAQKPLPCHRKLGVIIDNYIMRKFMFEKNPDHVYDFVIARWKEQKIIK